MYRRIAAVTAMVTVLIAGCGGEPEPDRWAQDRVQAATGEYPERVTSGPTTVTVEIAAPFAIADGRLRVLATAHEVRAEPLAAASGGPAYWSYGRDRAEVVGLEIAERGDDPLALIRWSDGAIVAVNARTGQPAWRVVVADLSPMKYEPVWLHRRIGVVSPADNGVVVLQTGPYGETGLDLATGRQLWQRDPATCAAGKYSDVDGWSTPYGGWVATYGCNVDEAKSAVYGLAVLDGRTGEVRAELHDLPQPRSDGCSPNGGCVLIATFDNDSKWRVGPDGALSPLSATAPAGSVPPVPLPAGEPALDAAFGTGTLASSVGAVDRLTRTPRWSVTLAGPSHPTPVVVDVEHGGDSVWVVGYLHNPERPVLHRFALDDGRPTGCFPAPLRRPLPYVIGMIYFVVDDGFPILGEQDSMKYPTDPFFLVLPGRDQTGRCP